MALRGPSQFATTRLALVIHILTAALLLHSEICSGDETSLAPKLIRDGDAYRKLMIDKLEKHEKDRLEKLSQEASTSEKAIAKQDLDLIQKKLASIRAKVYIPPPLRAKVGSVGVPMNETSRIVGMINNNAALVEMEFASKVRDYNSKFSALQIETERDVVLLEGKLRDRTTPEGRIDVYRPLVVVGRVSFKDVAKVNGVSPLVEKSVLRKAGRTFLLRVRYVSDSDVLWIANEMEIREEAVSEQGKQSRPVDHGEKTARQDLASLREWTIAGEKGGRFKGKLLAVDRDTVTIKLADGSERIVQVSQLADADRRYLSAQAAILDKVVKPTK